MRFAFISDIHGNLHALDLVLTDIQQQAKADHIICLGDIASLVSGAKGAPLHINN